jgi:hypothetical protein
MRKVIYVTGWLGQVADTLGQQLWERKKNQRREYQSTNPKLGGKLADPTGPAVKSVHRNQLYVPRPRQVPANPIPARPKAHQ